MVTHRQAPHRPLTWSQAHHGVGTDDLLSSCAPTLGLMMAASLAVRTQAQRKAPPGVLWRGRGVCGGGVVVSLP